MSRSVMLQRLLSLGPAHFPLAAEAMDLLGTLEPKKPKIVTSAPHFLHPLHESNNPKRKYASQTASRSALPLVLACRKSVTLDAGQRPPLRHQHRRPLSASLAGEGPLVVCPGRAILFVCFCFDLS
jgi:hypothetical protein